MSKSLDRLTLLETFIRIADAGSISAAARDLGLSQPSVSRQLAELESRFKAQLMRRTTHELSLTEAGAQLLSDARQLLDDWEALEEKHLDSGETLRGRLRVVAPVALGQLHLIDIALQFQQQHPLISLSWQLQDDDIRFAEAG
ncbi:MAG: LysR family transcriptional regulator, partial [Cyanobacteria bacterium J06648_10]